ncbi:MULTISPECIES: anti-sigma factor antagonist [unclassified Streptomyces]|uniref:anti-sigma factor antagonist n=1 Tax=unclassified Streptomyces TaxID=2593676 RepID=UPI001F033DD9|nr:MULTISPECIES: anti-sigma factor antagonist [unclassified Streptomyces]
MQHDPAPRTPHLRVRRAHGYTVLEFAGEIDIAAAAEIAPHLDCATAGDRPHVVIDLTRVEFFDCSGLRLLYRARSRTLDRNGRIHLVCTHQLTLRMLRLTGLARLLPPRPTVAAALGCPEATSDMV